MGTKLFTLNAAAYTDVSEGFSTISFIQHYVSQRSNTFRLVLADTVPTVGAANYDEFRAPESLAEEMLFNFGERDGTNRVYVRAVAGTLQLTVFQQ